MKNYSEKTLNKIEETLRNRVFIKFDDNVKIKKLEDIFDNLFNKNLRTLNIDNTIQCQAGRGRSYYDAYSLCLYYFPKMTFFEMYTTLRNYVKAENPTFTQYGHYNDPKFWVCYTIGRARFSGRLNFIKK